MENCINRKFFNLYDVCVVYFFYIFVINIGLCSDYWIFFLLMILMFFLL